MLADALLWAAHHNLALGRSELVDAVRTICLHGRAIPWDPEKGLGQSWVEGFFKRHPELSTRSSRIFEANRVQADDEERLREFYRVWNKYVSEEKPALDHIWNADETGERATRNQPSEQILQKFDSTSNFKL